MLNSSEHAVCVVIQFSVGTQLFLGYDRCSVVDVITDWDSIIIYLFIYFSLSLSSCKQR